MTGLRVKDVLRLHDGEPGGVEAMPVWLWWTLKARSMIFSNVLMPVSWEYTTVVRRCDTAVGQIWPQLLCGTDKQTPQPWCDW